MNAKEKVARLIDRLNDAIADDVDPGSDDDMFNFKLSPRTDAQIMQSVMAVVNDFCEQNAVIPIN